MTDYKPEHTNMTLLASGKSSRLQAMRQKSMHSPAAAANVTVSGPTPAEEATNPHWLLARQLIDRRLAEILAAFPPGRQRSLFKIRYGLDPDHLKQQPIRHIAKLLKIQHPLFTDPRGDQKEALELTYNHPA
ncbi:hypothetical protein NP590_06200 [Methylomonas sp. SURF-2]|uniref:Uncharacterized protein n=1 Tax=Methylomonas subterranea TaxID=2952225 RepID=A0ABT1TEH4_9GAMM|nr:hypothetical protein [Methylomonas sp. SURF-2]MCQ8103689.1 hypothetical protein [Methylomonas sp. SURF-2]